MDEIQERTRVIANGFSDWPAQVREELKNAGTNGQVGTRLLSDCGTARIWEVRLRPGQRLPFHRHVLDHFWTALSPGRAHSRSDDGHTREIEYRRGDTKRLHHRRREGMTHDLENVGDTELLFVTVEFLDGDNPPLKLRPNTSN
jgi:beta-alanine degradation protein BauB